MIDDDDADAPVRLPDTREVRPITFPVVGGATFGYGWMDCRDECTRFHKGTDMMAAKLQPLVSPVDGVVVRLLRHPTAGVGLVIGGVDGYEYRLYHLNNDSPGTDDGQAGPDWSFGAGLAPGGRVVAGGLVGFVGDSGNAEGYHPHVHVEIRRPDGVPINPYWSLQSASRGGLHCAADDEIDETWLTVAGVSVSPTGFRPADASLCAEPVETLAAVAAEALAAQVADWTTLQTQLDTCAGTVEEPTEVTLSGAIDATAEADPELRVNCVAVLDLAGFNLAVRNVVIAGSQQLTITDSADVDGRLTANATGTSLAGIQNTGAILIITGGIIDATGGANGAGIGGGGSADGGTITIDAGTVTATGGPNAAGIGGGGSADGGTITIGGGTVTATGGDSGAGIGGGRSGDGGAVTITGGVATANSGHFGAAIGGGENGDGATVVISAGAVVTAFGIQTAVGAGEGSAVSGSLQVDGTLRVRGPFLISDSDSSDETAEVVIGATGEVLGAESEPTDGAVIFGDGRIDNRGVIALSAELVTADGVTVTDNHYRVSFDGVGGVPVSEAVTVFAPSFAAGYRPFPVEPTRDGLFFQGWFTEPDGNGEPFTADSILAGTSTGAPVELTIHASWASTPRPCVAGGEVFGDVAATVELCGWVEELFRREFTSGCSTTPMLFCPNSQTTRAQMAVFLLKAVEGPAYAPPACTGTRFSDVTASTPFCAWIEELAARGITAGCGDGAYCPNNPVTRAQMAVFLLRAIEGTGYTPPPCSGPTREFADVPSSNPMCAWIEELAARGITAGCSSDRFCPNASITRAQMAVFLLRATT